jgi:hypothetical protein
MLGQNRRPGITVWEIFWAMQRLGGEDLVSAEKELVIYGELSWTIRQKTRAH